MKVSDLLRALPGARFAGSGDPDVVAVTHDSRRVTKGALFCALSGERADGRTFIGDAIARGAVAILTDTETRLTPNAPQILVTNPRAAMAHVAALVNGNPSARLCLVGVTGTSGKTTTATLIDNVLGVVHPVRGLFGTLVYRFGTDANAAIDATRTTPESTELQPMLAALLRSGGTAAVMECSSHALALERLVGCNFDVAVFTNLSHEHLDFHHDLDAYFEAKARLFDMLKPTGTAVVNVDDAFGRRLADRIPAARRSTFSLDPRSGADVVAAAHTSIDHTRLDVDIPRRGTRFTIRSPLLGRPNAENLLAATATGLALGIPPARLTTALAAVATVPGRLERIENDAGLTVLVDYAHKPAALEGVLRTTRALATSTGGHLITVFGCGGDRDRAKRPEMGRIAARLSDEVVVTSDNPRTEDPHAILDEICAGITDRAVLRIVDRRAAIGTAIRMARAGDVVLLAGKGHETYQEFADRKEPFDDRIVAKEVLDSLSQGRAAEVTAS